MLTGSKAELKMKFVLLAACILGIAFCAPPQKYMEFDIHYAPAQAAQAIPAGAPHGSLDVLLPVDELGRPVGGAARGFIKQEIPLASGRESKDVYYPFGFDVPAPAAPAPVVPVVPVAPAAPAAPVAPVAPAAPLVPIVAVAAPAAKPSGDDDEEEDD
ncbi:secretory calcium-binding phosphoprotein 7 [Mugil cephalus]|uniref:secretory calcium-binding phosphoprotein 7 n=1 Tax=Mugil cephalus TaxID=48193 RepID=UPI001FB62284|nr:secretory calcium-binding phosphoprotein 7 [Mugil cephalus]